jgi:hypothetical protein
LSHRSLSGAEAADSYNRLSVVAQYLFFKGFCFPCCGMLNNCQKNMAESSK